MKKPHSPKPHETTSPSNLINYLALMHAVINPGCRPDPGKHRRSTKVAASAVAAAG